MVGKVRFAVEVGARRYAAFHQCPGRDMIAIRKEIVRNGLYSAGHD
jgi:hypothetical protein